MYTRHFTPWPPCPPLAQCAEIDPDSLHCIDSTSCHPARGQATQQFDMLSRMPRPSCSALCAFCVFFSFLPTRMLLGSPRGSKSSMWHPGSPEVFSAPWSSPSVRHQRSLQLMMAPFSKDTRSLGKPQAHQPAWRIGVYPFLGVAFKRKPRRKEQHQHWCVCA